LVHPFVADARVEIGVDSLFGRKTKGRGSADEYGNRHVSGLHDAPSGSTAEVYLSLKVLLAEPALYS
jgi:hypothetical protein